MSELDLRQYSVGRSDEVNRTGVRFEVSGKFNLPTSEELAALIGAEMKRRSNVIDSEIQALRFGRQLSVHQTNWTVVTETIYAGRSIETTSKITLRNGLDPEKLASPSKAGARSLAKYYAWKDAQKADQRELKANYVKLLEGKLKHHSDNLDAKILREMEERYRNAPKELEKKLAERAVLRKAQNQAIAEGNLDKLRELSSHMKNHLNQQLVDLKRDRQIREQLLADYRSNDKAYRKIHHTLAGARSGLSRMKSYAVAQSQQITEVSYGDYLTAQAIAHQLAHEKLAQATVSAGSKAKTHKGRQAFALSHNIHVLGGAKMVDWVNILKWMHKRGITADPNKLGQHLKHPLDILSDEQQEQIKDIIATHFESSVGLALRKFHGT